MPRRKWNFKVGDRVILLRCDYPDNPVWQGPMGEVVGTVVHEDSGGGIHVNYDNGLQRRYEPSFSELMLYDEWLAKHPPAPPKFDIEALNKLVIDQQAKDEIISVLKQHQVQDKLFKEWGLGETIEYGKGMTFLFYGPPGTGKTWGAHCMAKCVGKELLVVSVAEIQSQEPGAANRNIQQAFQAARNKILFIDECDSLITSREGMGMVLASEINTLLTEIEKFEGVCILTTNRVEMLDPALERRIALIVEFPEPNYEQRKDIWKALIPDKLPLAEDVTHDKLAEHALTGGQIKNVLLQGARLALAAEADAVSLEHFEMAIKRLQKSKSLLGTASRYIPQLARVDYRKE